MTSLDVEKLLFMRQNLHFFTLFVRIALIALPVAWLVAMTLKASAQTAEEASDYLERLREDAMAQIQDETKSEEDKHQAFAVLVRENFDVPGAAKYILGRYWRSASREDRDDFILILQEVIEDRFFPLLLDYGATEFRILKAVEAKGSFIVTTSLQVDNGGEVNVFWRINPYENANGFIIRDVAPEGISLLSTYREDYGSALRQLGGDVGAFNERLREKLKVPVD